VGEAVNWLFGIVYRWVTQREYGPPPVVQTAPNSMQMPTPVVHPTMLILRGIRGHFADKDWPHGALDEPSALEYAKRRGYVGRVLDVSGEAFNGSPQAVTALAVFRYDPTVAAFYGFSGGGYNLRHILDLLTHDERARVKLVVVLGAPGTHDALQGPWELVYREDPPGGHMDGPRALLAEASA
jgi:hypothetical protein